jgi:hypothetical protein
MQMLDPWNQQLFSMIGRCKAVSARQGQGQEGGRQSKSAAIIEWQQNDEKCTAHIKRTIDKAATAARQSKSAAVISSSSDINKAKVIHDFIIKNHSKI